MRSSHEPVCSFPRHRDSHSRALAHLTFHRDLAPVGRDNLLHNIEAQPGAAGLGSMQGLENLGELRHWHAAPRIAHLEDIWPLVDCCARCVPPSFRPEPSGRRGRYRGVKCRASAAAWWSITRRIAVFIVYTLITAVSSIR